MDDKVTRPDKPSDGAVARAFWEAAEPKHSTLRSPIGMCAWIQERARELDAATPRDKRVGSVLTELRALRDRYPGGMERVVMDKLIAMATPPDDRLTRTAEREKGDSGGELDAYEQMLEDEQMFEDRERG